MNSANQMAEEIYGLHCDIGRLENLVKHWKTEFINEQDYAKMMELEADKAKAENAKLREFAADVWELLTCNEPVFVWKGLQEKAYELEVEVSE